MSRNPIARALPVHRHQVIPDKREKTYREHLNDTMKEGVPDWAAQLLDQMK